MSIEIENYLSQKEKICDLLLECIDDENDNIDDGQYAQLIENINQENIFDLKEFLHLILSIANNHHRQQYFFEKIEKILSLIKDQIKKKFSISELIELFKKNKRLLLILFDIQIISIKDPETEEYFKKMVSSISNNEIDDENENNEKNANTGKCCYFKKQKLIIKLSKKRTVNLQENRPVHKKPEQKIQDDFLCYFYPEIELFIGQKLRENLLQKVTRFSDYSEFINNRKIGENDSVICSLIRDDLIDEFIPYITKKNCSFSSLITPSIFETNSFLTKRVNQTSLIEYAAFHGSIQIFNYLRLNGAEMSPFLWLYAIHGRNAEIIHLLEENEVELIEDNYKFCLMEAIKCHHNEIAEYIQNKYQFSEPIEKVDFDIPYTYDSLFKFLNYGKMKSYNFDACSYSFKFHNYKYMKCFIDNEKVFFYSCKYGHYAIVKFLIKQNEIKFEKESEDNIKLLKTAEKYNNYDIIDLLISLPQFSTKCLCLKDFKNLTKIVVPDCISDICSNAFENCESLYEVVLPSLLKSIKENAFYNCLSLKEIVIPSSVIEIGKSCFCLCKALKQVKILSPITELNIYTFDGCSSLVKVELPSSLKKNWQFLFQLLFVFD